MVLYGTVLYYMSVHCLWTIYIRVYYIILFGALEVLSKIGEFNLKLGSKRTVQYFSKILFVLKHQRGHLCNKTINTSVCIQYALILFLCLCLEAGADNSRFPTVGRAVMGSRWLEEAPAVDLLDTCLFVGAVLVLC